VHPDAVRPDAVPVDAAGADAAVMPRHRAAILPPATPSLRTLWVRAHWYRDHRQHWLWTGSALSVADRAVGLSPKPCLNSSDPQHTRTCLEVHFGVAPVTEKSTTHDRQRRWMIAYLLGGQWVNATRLLSLLSCDPSCAVHFSVTGATRKQSDMLMIWLLRRLDVSGGSLDRGRCSGSVFGVELWHATPGDLMGGRRAGLRGRRFGGDG
jgi:hypothetical protein